MNRIVYDLSMLAALAMASIGAGMQWGVAAGLMVGGAGLAVCTVLAVYFGGSR